MFDDFIEKIPDTLKNLHQNDQDKDGPKDVNTIKTVITVIHRNRPKTAATDRACHCRKADDDNERECDSRNDTRKRFGQKHAKDDLKLTRSKRFCRFHDAGINLFKSPPSIIRAINGAVPIVKGTIIAKVPVCFPTKNLVTGKSTMMRMINGKERNMLIVTSKIL